MSSVPSSQKIMIPFGKSLKDRQSQCDRKEKGPKDVIGNDEPQGSNSAKNEIRKRFIYKNWTEVNGHPCEK